MGPPLRSALLNHGGRIRFWKDDDEDQHSAMLWASNRKVEVKEPEQREHKTRSTRCGSAYKISTAEVPPRSPLQECPRDLHCGSAHEMRNHSSNAQRRTKSNL